VAVKFRVIWGCEVRSYFGGGPGEWFSLTVWADRADDEWVDMAGTVATVLAIGFRVIAGE